ncbi:extracellular matrix regulator RemB [Fastidiosipila sanguinis]|uniref:DUF370 domain-containing protein n=1 Tax=Fastidiosipila sanguinis TaxID=236753 RepID=A0A2S0KPP1_9FIRM|nr:hypothetical protein C5Q98_07015 [Fastidiosipila sanguinis]
MYLHIGGEYQISTRYIIAIFDIDEITRENNLISLEFLSNIEKNKFLDIVSLEIPRSLIITLDRNYLSPISADTLKQRIKNGIKNYY